MRVLAMAGWVGSLLAGGCNDGEGAGKDQGGGDDDDVPTPTTPFTPTTPTTPEPGSLQTGTLCTDRGWCWETPLPAGGNATGIWAVAPDDVWAASPTHLFHWDGAELAHAAPPTLTPYLNFMPVWGTASDDVWSHGFNGFIHWDGQRWSIAQEATYASSIHGVAWDDAWAVGFSSVYRYEGSSWTLLSQLSAGLYQDVWAIGPDEAVVSGDNGEVGVVRLLSGETATDLDYPGDAWSVVSVYASGPDDVWASDPRGILHLAGGVWESVAPNTLAFDIWGSGPDDVWFATQLGGVMHWDGSALETVAFDEVYQTLRITGTPEGDVWVSDYDGALHHYDGAGWTSLKQPLTESTITDLAVTASGEGWAVSWTDLLRRAPDGTWTTEPSPTTAVLRGVADADGEVFLFAQGPVYRRSGGGWDLTIGGDGLVDACRTDDGTVWGVGDRVATFAAGEWVDDPVVPRTDLGRILCDGGEAWATSADPYGWADTSALLHFDGADWRHQGLATLHGMEIGSWFAPAPDAVWVVATDPYTGAGLALRWDGSVWEEVRVPSGGEVLGVGGTSATDVWLVGTGFVAHDDGAGPVEISGAPAGRLRWVASGGDGTASVVAEDGAIWDYDGSAWTGRVPPLASVASVSSDVLVDVAFANGEVFGAGDRDEALGVSGGAWVTLPGYFSADQVEGSDEAGVWFVDFIDRLGRWNGAEVEEVGSGASGVLLVPTTGPDVVLVGNYESVQVWSGSAFVEESTPPLEYPVWAFGYSLDELWVSGENSADPFHDGPYVQRRSAGGWETFAELTEPLAFGHPPSGDTLLIDTSRAIWRKEGAGWRLLFEAPPYGADYPATGAQVLDLDDIWVVALGGVLHWDGAWDTLAEPLGLGFTGMVTGGDGAAWVFGTTGWIASRGP